MVEKGKLPNDILAKRAMIEPGHPQLSIHRQCKLIGLNRATFYCTPAQESDLNLHLMRLIDEQYIRTPFYGWPRMTAHLHRQGYLINHKRVQRLMRKMGLQAIYPKQRTSVPAEGHKVYPYLLRNLAITRSNQVWSADITFIPMPRGFMYLVAIMDWYSRYVVAWQLSNTLDGGFCLDALEQSLAQGKPEIFNTDQGAQFTARAFTSRLEVAGVRVSMDGRGRVLDNIFVERLWRSVKYEDVYLKEYATVPALEIGLHSYFSFYNHERPHQSLSYRVPAEVHFECQPLLPLNRGQDVGGNIAQPRPSFRPDHRRESRLRPSPLPEQVSHYRKTVPASTPNADKRRPTGSITRIMRRLR